jgi:hypothetical protein
MSLTVLAYNIKRAIKVLGVHRMIEALVWSGLPFFAPIQTRLSADPDQIRLKAPGNPIANPTFHTVWRVVKRAATLRRLLHCIEDE